MGDEDTEIIDKLFLELSQFTNAETGAEIMYREENDRLTAELANYKRSSLKWGEQMNEHMDRIAELEAELADWRNTAEQAAGEMCGDEKHCVCVPALRVLLTQERECIAGLRAELAEALELLGLVLGSFHFGNDDLGLEERIRAAIDDARGSD